MTPPAHAHDRPGSRLRRFLLRGLAVQVFSVLIGVLLAVFTRSGFGLNLAYSMAIGNACWLSIDAGIHGLALVANGKLAPSGEARWPGLPATVAIVALGAMIGYTAGTSLVDALLGTRSHSLFGNRTSAITTLIAAVTMTYFFHSRERLQAERTAAEAARRLALENQLKLIESQLEPHMLFNTLANLRVLIGLDPPQAQAMLDRLIAFLRATLNASRSGAHPLSAEFDRLADYLALMAVRMGPRLAVEFHLPEALRSLLVPPLLLQPLVENAIKHGLEPKVEGGRIEVRAEREGDQLRLSVRDTGVGLDATPSAAPAGTAPEGLHYGTSHVRERLATLYGDRARFELGPAPDDAGGTLALLCLPLTLPTPAAGPATP